VQVLEHSGYQHLASDRFATDLRAFAARVERELDVEANRQHLRLADAGGSGVSDD
jgi:hypothetical protein